MTELDLDKLCRRKAPEPQADARERAMAAAMQAFDDAEKNPDAPQGSPEGVRQSSIFNRIWSPLMNRKLLAGSALATLLVIPVAGLVTLELVRNGTVALAPQEAQVDPVATDKKLEAGRAQPEVKDDARADQDAATPEQKPLADAETAETEVAVTEPAPATAEVEGGAVLAERPLAIGQAAKTRSLTRTLLPSPVDALPLPREENRERFASEDPNPVKSVSTDPVSTFSADVDTASYSFVRRALLSGSLPEREAVRVEEMVNYFPYDWAGPDNADTPFKATVTVTPTPWNSGTELMHIGIKGFETVAETQPAANLVFLIDVSGSMNEPDKLPLLKSAFRLLVGKLKPTDTVSIVTYAGNAGVVLEPTAAKDSARILAAIDGLQPGGSTAGAEGIDAAYALAEKAFVKDGVNRVMLATDGDFNVGPSSDDDLKARIEEKRRKGIFLSVLGFGRGNYNDGMMQALAQNGNGTAAYIDTLAEAQKTLVEEAGSSLFPIAKDVKFQVEFNPAHVAEYRLIGYETRALAREDFNNDKVDAGDIGSGHRVTAIYEVTPKGSPAVLNDPLRYGAAEAEPAGATSEIAFLKMRYKAPTSDTSELVTLPVTDANMVPDLAQASADVRFSIAVAVFGQKLKGVTALQDYSFGSILGLAEAARGTDPFGYRAEFLNLVRLAGGLSGEKAQ